MVALEESYLKKPYTNAQDSKFDCFSDEDRSCIILYNLTLQVTMSPMPYTSGSSVQAQPHEGEDETSSVDAGVKVTPLTTMWDGRYFCSNLKNNSQLQVGRYNSEEKAQT